MHKNLLALNIFSFFKGFMLLMPIVVLFFQSRWLSLWEIFLLQSIFAFSVFALEVPTGFVWDKRWRKSSLILWAFVSVAGYLVYTVWFGFWRLVVAELILALWYTLVSWSDTALLYDTLLSESKQNTYKKHIWRYYSINALSEWLAWLLWWYLATFSLVVPAYAQVWSAVIAVIALLFVTEPPRHKLDESVSIMRQFGDIVTDLWHKRPNVLALISYGALIGVATFAMTWFVQPFLSETNYPLWAFGLVWAGINWLVALFSRQSHNIEIFLGKKNTLIWLLVAVVIGFVGLGSWMMAPALIFVVLFQFARSLSNVVISDYINELIPSDRRATIMSLQSLLMRGWFAILWPLMWFAADLWSLQVALLMCWAFFVVAGWSLLWKVRKRVF